MTPDLACIIGRPSEANEQLAASEAELWAASCGLARTSTLDKWLSGERREFGARLLLRACVVEARRLWSLAVLECSSDVVYRADVIFKARRST